MPELQIVDRDVWERVQRQLLARAQTPPQQQRRGAHLLSRMGRCGVCGSGWIRIKSGFWGCAGVRDGTGCSNTRQISDERYQARVLHGLKDKLLDPDAVELYVREYHAESLRRDREDSRTRLRLERKIAEADRRLDRLIEAIASGAATFGNVKNRMYENRADRERSAEELAGLQSARVIALHPKIADDYRREVQALDQLLENNTPEMREEVVPRLRSLIESIVLTPSKTGRGVDIEITGRLTQMVELATGKPLGDAGMITMERVKGIEPSS